MYFDSLKFTNAHYIQFLSDSIKIMQKYKSPIVLLPFAFINNFSIKSLRLSQATISFFKVNQIPCTISLPRAISSNMAIKGSWSNYSTHVYKIDGRCLLCHEISCILDILCSVILFISLYFLFVYTHHLLDKGTTPLITFRHYYAKSIDILSSFTNICK